MRQGLGLLNPFFDDDFGGGGGGDPELDAFCRYYRAHPACRQVQPIANGSPRVAVVGAPPPTAAMPITTTTAPTVATPATTTTTRTVQLLAPVAAVLDPIGAALQVSRTTAAVLLIGTILLVLRK